jgi:hypothetical protein
MHKYIWIPGWWVLKHKLFMGNRYRLEENEFVMQAAQAYAENTRRG